MAYISYVFHVHCMIFFNFLEKERNIILLYIWNRFTLLNFTKCIIISKKSYFLWKLTEKLRKVHYLNFVFLMQLKWMSAFGSYNLFVETTLDKHLARLPLFPISGLFTCLSRRSESIHTSIDKVAADSCCGLGNILN